MTELAREYGEGLYILARDEDIRLQIGEELKTITEILKQQPDYIRLLASRAINLEERIRVVDDTFAGKAHPYLVNFMKLLIQRGKIDAFYDCAEWFSNRCNEDFGIVEARVTTAAELSEEQLRALKEKLDNMTGKDTRLNVRIAPAVLGGVRVEMNGRKFDTTIQNRLERLKLSLTKG